MIIHKKGEFSRIQFLGGIFSYLDYPGAGAWVIGRIVGRLIQLVLG